MNSSRGLIFSANGDFGMDRKMVGTASKLPPLPHAISEQAGHDRLSVLDCRIECLMVLAQTLLREIEILREQSGTLRFTNANLPAEVHRFEAELLRTALIRTGGRQGGQPGCWA